MKPAEAIPEQRLAALQARLEALHAAKLLGDDELYALEDMVADFVEFEASLVGVVTHLHSDFKIQLTKFLVNIVIQIVNFRH